MHDLWISRYFSIVWALFFKLPSPFISPFTFPNFLIHYFESLPLRLLLRLFRLCSSDFPLPICAVLFRGMFLLSLSFFFFLVTYCEFLIPPLFSLFLYLFIIFFLFTVIVFVLWFLGFSVYFSLSTLFLGVHGW